MSEKRKREGGAGPVDYRPGNKKQKTQRKGFTVGPANLPDGVYKRKNQAIKAGLIERAQIKKNYAKLQRQGKVPTKPETLPQPASLRAEEAKAQAKLNVAAPKPAEPDAEIEAELEPDVSDLQANDEEPSSTSTPHPDRQTLIEKEAEDPAAEEPEHRSKEEVPRRRRPRQPKPQPFKREYDSAQQRKAEAEERRAAREEAERQRQGKIEERERFRRAMAKARTGGPNGQRKLGRESQVLLERVRRMVGDGGG